MIERGAEVIIPNGLFTLQADDVLSLTGDAAELRRFFTVTGQSSRPIKRVVLMGGGRVAVYLTRMLQESGMRVTVIERDAARCARLCDLIPDAMIINGDATRSDTLLQEGLTEADAFVTLTGDDGDNIVTALYAGRVGVRKIITKVNREHFGAVLESSGVGSIVSPKELVAQQITGYARAMQNSAGSSMESLHKLADGRVEALEYKIAGGSKLTGKPLKDLRLKPNILISAVIRGGKCLVPNGATVITPGDHIVVVCAAGKLKQAEEILA